MPISVGFETRLEPLAWAIIEPHREQAMKNHGQTLERLRERGGLGPCEAVAILEDRRWRRMFQADAIERLDELRRDANLCNECGLLYGYHDNACSRRDLTHLAEAP